eukprot:52315-Pelagomonas_calceolata.AAC.2
MPDPDVMELPDAATLYPIVCEHICKLNARASPVFIAIAAPFIKYAEKRIPAVSGRGTDRSNVLTPYNARLLAAMMEKDIQIPARWKIAEPSIRRALCWTQENIACSQLVVPCIGCILTFSGSWSLDGAKQE